ncbi:uncharacterized protein LOC130608621 [Pezoporus wallicus]|uniref:uncharacterized protein LOC130608621 n=1 Tax=Pezoporus wallicus TaxID=35540 RepID=UPI00254DDC38|nr:uncharacterized protein LOC130608621 [Pezoporus wallicus]
MIIISVKLLLTMCFGCLATGPSNITVIQTPTKMRLSIGDYTEIACIWEKSVVRYRVSWYLLNKENITTTISSKLLYVYNDTSDSKDVLVINSANINNTGFYYCEIIIKIPFCKKVCGNGTTVIVEEKEAHSLNKRDLAICAIIPFLVAPASLSLCYRKKQKQRSKLPSSALLPVPTGGHQGEGMLEAAEVQGRSESTSGAAEENSAEWVSGL